MSIALAPVCFTLSTGKLSIPQISRREPTVVSSSDLQLRMAASRSLFCSCAPGLAVGPVGRNEAAVSRTLVGGVARQLVAIELVLPRHAEGVVLGCDGRWQLVAPDSRLGCLIGDLAGELARPVLEAIVHLVVASRCVDSAVQSLGEETSLAVLGTEGDDVDVHLGRAAVRQPPDVCGNHVDSIRRDSDVAGVGVDKALVVQLRAIQAVTHGRHASEHLLHSLAERLHDLVAPLPQQLALQSCKAASCSGKAGDSVAEHRVAQDACQPLVAGGSQLLQPEHGGNKGLIVQEGVKCLSELLLHGLTVAPVQVVGLGIPFVETLVEVNVRAGCDAARLARQQRMSLFRQRNLLNEGQSLGGEVGLAGAHRCGAPHAQVVVEPEAEGTPRVELALQALHIDKEVNDVPVGEAVPCGLRRSDLVGLHIQQMDVIWPSRIAGAQVP
mmetsp:Transcript_14776/g.44631  ORF Transcript_14776/g.44631 Transcript_14776/m.44631 type:complete len:441 (-) Transcript_14776:298-1620(-)